MALTKNDLENIGKLVDTKLNNKLKPIEETLKVHTASLIKIERDIETALELRQDVAEVKEQVKGHEERIPTLEKFPKI